jgi:hypothetical protein
MVFIILVAAQEMASFICNEGGALYSNQRISEHLDNATRPWTA